MVCVGNWTGFPITVWTRDFCLVMRKAPRSTLCPNAVAKQHTKACTLWSGDRGRDYSHCLREDNAPRKPQGVQYGWGRTPEGSATILVPASNNNNNNKKIRKQGSWVLYQGTVLSRLWHLIGLKPSTVTLTFSTFCMYKEIKTLAINLTNILVIVVFSYSLLDLTVK